MGHATPHGGGADTAWGESGFGSRLLGMGCQELTAANTQQWGSPSRQAPRASLLWAGPGGPDPPHPIAGPARGTCMGARQGAEQSRVLAVAIVHLHHVIEGRVEEGELSEHHCGGRQCGELSVEDCVPCWGEGWEVWGTQGQEEGSLRGSRWFLGRTPCWAFLLAD